MAESLRERWNALLPALKEQLRAESARPFVRVADIKIAVCQQFDVTARDLDSHRTGRSVARPRQVAMYLARELTQMSLPEIGRQFGDRDHTTVIHACRRVEKILHSDQHLAAIVGEIAARLTDPDQPTLPLGQA